MFNSAGMSLLVSSCSGKLVSLWCWLCPENGAFWRRTCWGCWVGVVPKQLGVCRYHFLHAALPPNKQDLRSAAGKVAASLFSRRNRCLLLFSLLRRVFSHFSSVTGLLCDPRSDWHSLISQSLTIPFNFRPYRSNMSRFIAIFTVICVNVRCWTSGCQFGVFIAKVGVLSEV